MSLSHGKQYGRYVIEHQLGAGGAAVVYLARHAELGSLHALKVPLHNDDSGTARLLREGRMQATLRHPNIVPITDIVYIDGVPCLIMEYVSGPTLSERLQEASPLPLQEACRLARDILQGVAAAHDEGIIHRDIKPSNILLDAGEEHAVARITDFGLSKALMLQEDTVRLTQTGMVIGTPAYMAPEQIRAPAGADQRVDVYALGVVFYELFCGRLPFEGADLLELFAQIRSGIFPSPSELRPDIPLDIEAILLQALEHEPVDRFMDAREMLQVWDADVPAAIEPAADTVPAPAMPAPVAPDPPLPARSSRWPLIFGGLGAAVLALGVWGFSTGPAVTPSPMLPVEPVREPPVEAVSASEPEPAVVVSEPTPEPVGVPASGVPASGVPASGVPASGVPASEPPEEEPAREEPASAPPAEEPLSETVAVEEPAEEPIEEPAATEAVMGRVTVVGEGVTVVLRSAAGTFSPGPVAPGAYTVEVRFPEALAPTTLGELTVGPSEERVIRCESRLRRCVW